MKIGQVFLDILYDGRTYLKCKAYHIKSRELKKRENKFDLYWILNLSSCFSWGEVSLKQGKWTLRSLAGPATLG